VPLFVQFYLFSLRGLFDKLQNGAIPLILKIGKKLKYTFCKKISDDDVITVSITVSICVLLFFSTSYFSIITHR